MKSSLIQLPPFGLSRLCLVLSTLLFCPAVSPQDSPIVSPNPAKPVSPQGFKSRNFRKAGLEFIPPVWPPTDVDAAEVSVNADVSCPLSKVLQGASKHATEFSANLDRFTATEIIQSVDAQKYGPWEHWQTRKFDYMAIVTHPRAGVAYVEESRVAKGEVSPPKIRTEGLAVTILIFHPQNINDFEMVCEGMTEWHGKPSWTVHFAQKPGIPLNFQMIHADDKRFGVKLKGRAWIDEDNYEIQHIDTDLLEQIPEIQLFTEHVGIDYGSVKFTNRNAYLWLPQQVEFSMELGNRHFYNHHQLTNFVLFSVGVQQDTKEPKLPNE
jgi:hypothetical protein